MKKLLILAVIISFLFSCSQKVEIVEWVSTTSDSLFIENAPLIIAKSSEKEKENVNILIDQPLQTIEGFGGCFNELGWLTLSELSEKDKRQVIEDLFGKEGMNFTYCRMPIGANDFAKDWYSFNETAGDFEMKNFSIENDKSTIIPFIKAAKEFNPNLRIWASPWSPPTWMKYNRHYACAANSNVNDLRKDKEGGEGKNMFIQEPEYFKAYALYFRKFIEAYRNEGINIEMVAPQNEFNSCQIFPSCTWTATGLGTFIGDYLGPEMKNIGVRTMLGTMERGNSLLVDTIMQGNSKDYISEIGFQWAGKDAIKTIRVEYPEMKLMQTESECGDGTNSWEYCFYIWKLMKHYFRNGASAYMYWNISLDADAANNRWKWPQNSLISVDTKNKTYKYNPEYYLMKQFSHFVKPDAKFLTTEGEFENILAFMNPDNSIVVIAANEKETPHNVRIRINEKLVSAEIKPYSINTFLVK